MFTKIEDHIRNLTHRALHRIHWPRRGLLISAGLSAAGMLLMDPNASVDLYMPGVGLTVWARNDILSLWPYVFTALVVSEMLLKDRGIKTWILLAPTLWLISALLLGVQLTLVVGVNASAAAPWLWAAALTALFVPMPRLRARVPAE